MQNKAKQICMNCIYYNDGICRRFPPHSHYGFPKVKKDDWCGEFMDSHMNPNNMLDLMKNLLGSDVNDISLDL